MTLVKESAMKVQDIPVGKLVPNPWNPNTMKADTYAKLKAYIEREGFAEPIVVRPVKGKYEIIGGFHRWKVAQELGHKTVPCVVMKLVDRRAKILSINLNELHGESVPHLLADLVHDLSHDLSLDDLATQLPYDVADLEDLADLLRVPDGLDLRLEQEAAESERTRTKVLSFPLTPKQNEIVENAIASAKEATGGTSRAAALTHVARGFLRNKDNV